MQSDLVMLFREPRALIHNRSVQANLGWQQLTGGMVRSGLKEQLPLAGTRLVLYCKAVAFSQAIFPRWAKTHLACTPLFPASDRTQNSLNEGLRAQLSPARHRGLYTATAIAEQRGSAWRKDGGQQRDARRRHNIKAPAMETSQIVPGSGISLPSLAPKNCTSAIVTQPPQDPPP